MQAKASHNNTIPPNLLPPAKKPPPTAHNHNKITFPPTNNIIPRAISITAPPGLDVAPPPEQLIDDKITAFWDYQFLFVSQRSETTEPITLRIIDGEIPADFPSGTYYLTGPGLFTDDHGSTVHPLDGHGYLRTFKIINGVNKVEFMAKYIQTEAQVEERDPVTGQWRFTHRGPFSVLKGGKMVGNTKVMKNVANTSVLKWGGRLLCLWEGGDPYEIESGSLDTVGRFFDIVNGGDQWKKEDDDDDDEEEGFRKMNVLDLAAEILKPILYGKHEFFGGVKSKQIPKLRAGLIN